MVGGEDEDVVYFFVTAEEEGDTIIVLIVLLWFLFTYILLAFYGDCKGDAVNDNNYNLLMLFVLVNGPANDEDGETGADNDILDGKFVC